MALTMPGSVQPSEQSESWMVYLWDALKKFGFEFYHTWRWELSTSAVIAIVVYSLTRQEDASAWRNLVATALATGYVLGGFALWHIIRTPLLIHRHTIRQERVSSGWGFGILGLIALGALLVGLYCVAKITVHHAVPDIVAPSADQGAKDAQIAQLKKQIHEPCPSRAVESSNSLRHQVWRLADQIDQFWVTKRREVLPNQPGDDQQKINQRTQVWMNASDQECKNKFNDKTRELIQKLEAKGVDTRVHGWLEFPVILNQRCLTADELLAFRDLSYKVDAQDIKVHPAP
jgi:hypothetical protein